MIVQTTKPKIEFYHTGKDGTLSLYYVFSPTFNPQYPMGQGLVSYNYQVSVNQFTSQWSCQIKENPKVENSFYDMLEDFDVVMIYENSGYDIDYIGLITTRSFQANASGPTKNLNISGKGIEYLFEYFTIALDSTAMAFSQSTLNVNAANAYKLTLNKEGISFREALEQIFKVFNDFSNRNYSGLSNTIIGKMIDYIFGSNFLDAEDIKFNYPITSNLFSNTTINYVNYVKQLLPDNVYEFHGIITRNGIPKLRVRENPFSKNDWKKLISYKLNPEHITSYTLTRSIDEVYTVFMAYLEGSTQSADYYRNVSASSKGYDNLAKNEEKIKKFGYKLLTCNFRGFNTALAEDEKSVETLSEKFKEQNEKVKEWYDHLDELYDATITIVNVHDGKDKAKVGDKISFIGGEFYVTGEDHQWNFGNSPEIIYHCERGGLYNSDGSYSGPIKKISTNRVELK